MEKFQNPAEGRPDLSLMTEARLPGVVKQPITWRIQPKSKGDNKQAKQNQINRQKTKVPSMVANLWCRKVPFADRGNPSSPRVGLVTARQHQKKISLEIWCHEGLPPDPHLMKLSSCCSISRSSSHLCTWKQHRENNNEHNRIRQKRST